jgi:hypothetical protein
MMNYEDNELVVAYLMLLCWYLDRKTGKSLVWLAAFQLET